ncbi:hypothetical protein MSAN_01186400 [Mycena sanguinolenta]|uniref:DUF6534 domain-containing protein n=1 Tax=Mycena sanguinolenta TaxID=230812 RepID=A0A8H7D7C2_9AGAR|nr:hypothetical protein MSAN_01186400 [Mycena sanguinolenta]
MVEGLDSLPLTVGALVGGCMTAVGLSAIVGFQVFLYFQLFTQDTLLYKCLVAWIWIIDTGHTFAICTMIWQYAVVNYNNPAKLLEIVSAYPVHIIMTVIATLNANAFYTWRLHKMSKSNWWLTGPLCLLCLARTILGLFVATEMLRSNTRTWEHIHAHFEIGEVTSWTISATTDIVISLARYYYLRDLKQGYMPTQEMVDAVVIFTVNDGLLTCAIVITLVTCFFSMKKNFVWIALFMTLAKLFSNSILTTLNLRNWYRHRHRPMGILLTRHIATRDTVHSHKSTQFSTHDDIRHIPATVEVFVDKEVEYAVGRYN